MKFWKVLRLYLKQNYSKWLLAVMGAFLAMDVGLALTSPSGNTYKGDIDISLIFDAATFALIVLLVSSLSRPGQSLLVKSDVDITFATPADPFKLHLIRAASQGLSYLWYLFILTFPGALINPPLYAVDLLLVSGLFAVVATNSLLYPQPRRDLYLVPFLAVFALGLLKPQYSPLYGLFDPSPLYSAYDAALLAAALIATPKRRIYNLATNAYGILGSPTAGTPGWALGRGVYDAPVRAPGGGIPKTFWGAIWTTSIRPRDIYSRRRNALKLMLPISTAGAVAYYLLTAFVFHTVGELVMASAFSFFYILFMLFLMSAVTLSAERLWISLSVDPARYFRYRMLARTAITAMALAPWVFVYGLQSLYFKPSAFLAVGLVSAVLVVPPASWLLAAVLHIPQIRELGIPQRYQKAEARFFLAVLAFMAAAAFMMFPYALSAMAMYIPAFSGLLELAAVICSAALLALSALFFYFVVISPRGLAVWGWLVNKLSEEGYV